MTPEQTKRFKYWQTRTIVATMIGYALFYFVRKNFSLAMPGLEADLGISKTSLGIFLTLNGVVYGLSRFVNGILADRMNARWYMAVGLALCALANFAFGFGEDVSYWITGQHDGSQFTNTMILFMGIMWVINGMLQGTGFPPCARLLTHWIPPTQLATKMSVWNTSHSIGAGLVVILCGYIMGTLGMNVSADPDAVAAMAANLGVQPGDAAGMGRVMTRPMPAASPGCTPMPGRGNGVSGFLPPFRSQALSGLSSSCATRPRRWGFPNWRAPRSGRRRKPPKAPSTVRS